MTAGNADLLEIAETVARQAGALVKQRRFEGVEVAHSKSAPEDVVTFADQESEHLIRSLLAELRPDDGFHGEETDPATGTSGLVWVVDPIDGTVNYLYGHPAYAVSIAVVEGEANPQTWTALAGTVFNPAIEECYTATLDGGAYLNGRALEVGPQADLSLALVGTGFAYSGTRRQEQGRILAELAAEVRDFRRGGAASLDLCNLATGRVDAYYERGLKAWDLAAGSLIATEAGARFAASGVESDGSWLVIGARPDIFDAFQSRVRELDLKYVTRLEATEQ